jgi:hypothetical protein
MRTGAENVDKNMNAVVELKHKDVTDKILRAFFKIVYPQLGYGFLEKGSCSTSVPNPISVVGPLTMIARPSPGSNQSHPRFSAFIRVPNRIF